LHKRDLWDICRQAFEEARANAAHLWTLAHVNRFVAEIIGPMRVMPGGTVCKSDAAHTDKPMWAVPTECGWRCDDGRFRDPETRSSNGVSRREQSAMDRGETRSTDSEASALE